MSDRYDDKPFLRYVDAWVLNAIGHLDEPTRAYCVAMEPTMRQSLGLTGSWTQIVAQQMKFAPTCPRRSARYGKTASCASSRATAVPPTRCNSR